MTDSRIKDELEDCVAANWNVGEAIKNIDVNGADPISQEVWPTWNASQTELLDEMLKELLEYICIKPFSSQSINLAASSVIVSSLSENKTRTMRVKPNLT